MACSGGRGLSKRSADLFDRSARHWGGGYVTIVFVAVYAPLWMTGKGADMPSDGTCATGGVMALLVPKGAEAAARPEPADQPDLSFPDPGL